MFVTRVKYWFIYLKELQSLLFLKLHGENVPWENNEKTTAYFINAMKFLLSQVCNFVQVQVQVQVQFSRSVMSDSLWPHGLQHTRPPCPSPTPWVYSNSCPLNRWCHPTISSSVVPFSSCLQSFPGSGSFLISQFFPSGGQYIGVSALTSVLSMNIQDWSPLG